VLLFTLQRDFLKCSITIADCNRSLVAAGFVMFARPMFHNLGVSSKTNERLPRKLLTWYVVGALGFKSAWIPWGSICSSTDCVSLLWRAHSKYEQIFAEDVKVTYENGDGDSMELTWKLECHMRRRLGDNREIRGNGRKGPQSRTLYSCAIYI
jgi:hypothetical protein